MGQDQHKQPYYSTNKILTNSSCYISIEYLKTCFPTQELSEFVFGGNGMIWAFAEMIQYILHKPIHDIIKMGETGSSTDQHLVPTSTVTNKIVK